MPPKVVHITPVYPPYAGGIGIAASLMVDGLRQRGWDVDVITPKPSPALQKTVLPHQIYLKPLVRVGNAAIVPQLRRLKGYDIIHLHLPFFGGAEWVKLKARFIVHYHHDADAGGLKGLFFKTYDKFILPRILKRADKVVVSTLDYARHSRIAKYIDDRFIEIPFGVDSKRFHPFFSHPERSDSEVEGSLANASGHAPGIPRQARNDIREFKILFVGSLDRAHWFKGLDILLRALSLLKKQYGPTAANEPHWKCSIIGDGDQRPQYEQMSERLGLQSETRFFGKVPYDDLPQYYQNADCFIFPSVSRAEAFGLVVLEAMASGLPVIASDLPGVRTLINCSPPGKGEIQRGCESCGLTFPPDNPRALADRINQLINNEPLRKQMGENARKRIMENYTINQMIDKIEKIYQDSTIAP